MCVCLNFTPLWELFTTERFLECEQSFNIKTEYNIT